MQGVQIPGAPIITKNVGSERSAVPSFGDHPVGTHPAFPRPHRHRLTLTGLPVWRMPRHVDTDAANRRAWNSGRVAQSYVGRNHLFPAELAILGELWHELAGQRVLDLGVGGGRTTAFLLALTDDYVGVDYSDAMVAIARAANPTADIRVGDARDLSDLPAASFAFALFSFNGIDYLPYEDRGRAIREVHRLLVPGGYFAFSTHNLNTLGGRETGVYRRLPIGMSLNPIRSGVRLTRWVASSRTRYANFRRLRPLEHSGDGYAVLNDGAEDYALLTTYVDPHGQCVELERCGFEEPARLYGHDGRAASVDSDITWLHYLVRKPDTDRNGLVLKSLTPADAE